ncbi:MAG: hypothetical protein GFH27_549325n56 [Chloroflexi bacterium AL-W]|nr:hypothetical protein [Chloroflexi bacterium AL-N1]NOK70094.1 hypothetical protein [Chloroflexi bacterium AL-N10]NOK77894.1 hypothetical protein [Chloroflexi bacterium AL-N5]NOK84903.1 hypothetical protein [Chloroflexi bacterium AL-W]NOK91882.1 hypothetical protein [Chloroflexi bacterium AL-N15]
MTLLTTLSIIFVGMVIAWACALYAQHLRTRHPEKYRGMWAFWGDVNRPAWRATLPFVGMFLGAILVNGIRVLLNPNETQTMALQINALFLLITFLAIVFAIALYKLRQGK